MQQCIVIYLVLIGWIVVLLDFFRKLLFSQLINLNDKAKGMGRQKMLYLYPPDLEKAEKHRLANRIFKGIQKDPLCPQCPCCDRKVGVQTVETSCCYDKSQLAFLGPGVPLFFAYVRNCVILLITFTLIFSGYCLYSNISESNCGISSAGCQHNIFNTISFANKMNNTDLLSIQNYIVLTFVVVNIFLFHFFRYNFRKIEEECDDIVNSPSDYAVILRRLPEQITKEDLELMVEKRREELNEDEKAKTENLKIDHIVLSFHMGEYTRVMNENLEKLKELISEDKVPEFKPQECPKLTQTAKLAIIVFSRQESKNFFLYKPSLLQRFLYFLCDPCTPLSNFEVKGQRVSIQRAPEPDDVVWQNSKISIKGAIFRKIIYNLLGALLLFSGGVAQYWMAVLQQSITDKLVSQMLSIGLSILIAIFNFLIEQFLIFSTVKQRNETLTEFNTVLTVKISFFQFLNTGIFVVLANFLADIKHFTITQSLPTDVTIVMISNAIIPNLSLWVLNYFEIIGKLMRWLVKSERMKVTQLEANKMWEGPQAQIPYKYGYVLKTLWLTAFYAPLVPVVIPISIIGLVLNYFIEKDLYRKVYNVPNMLSSMVNDSAFELLEYFPLIISLGEFIIYVYAKNYDVTALPENWSITIYVSIGLSFLNLLLPMDRINKKIIKLKSDSSVCPPYEQVEDKFEVTYEMTNPAYECKKKRKRDVFLFNHIFGGDTNNVGVDMTAFLGLNETDKSMIKDSLIDKNSTNEPLNNVLDGLNSPNGSKEDKNENIKAEGGNPFAAFMKLNAVAKDKKIGAEDTNATETSPVINKKFPTNNNVQEGKNIFDADPINQPSNNKNLKAQQVNHQGMKLPQTNSVQNPSEVIAKYKSIQKDLKLKYNSFNKNSKIVTQYLNPLNQLSSDEKDLLSGSNKLQNNKIKQENNEVKTAVQKQVKNQQERKQVSSDIQKPPVQQKKQFSLSKLLSALKEKQINSNPSSKRYQLPQINTGALPNETKTQKSMNQNFRINSPTKKKFNIMKPTDEQYSNFLHTFPNLDEEREISKQVKKKFIAESPKQLNYLSKRFTDSGTIFVQKPQPIDGYSRFPHVEIHVPIKPVVLKESNGQDHQNSIVISSHQKSFQELYDEIETNNVPSSQKKNLNEFATNNIYDPRAASGQTAVDMNKMFRRRR